MPIAADETLFVYTDGVIDTRGEHERFGPRRLSALLREARRLDSPEALLSELEAALDRFQVGAQADDTAALALRPAAPPRARWQQPHTHPGGRRPYPSGVLTGRGYVAALPNFRIDTARTGSGITIKLAGRARQRDLRRAVERFERARRRRPGR